jgi:hypothetical protein
MVFSPAIGYMRRRSRSRVAFYVTKKTPAAILGMKIAAGECRLRQGQLRA